MLAQKLLIVVRARLAAAVCMVNAAFERSAQGNGQDSSLNLLIDTIPQVGFAAGFVQKRFNATIFNRRLVTVERVAGQTHHLADLARIAKHFGKVQKADCMVDDPFVTLVQEGYFWARDDCLVTTIKAGNPKFENCDVLP